MCVIFLYNFMWFFLKFIYACHYFFLPNLDLLELLGVFTAICHSNECLVFVCCSRCVGVVSWKFFVIKFHSNMFFRNCFVMFPFLTACWGLVLCLNLLFIFGVTWLILAQFWPWYYIFDIINMLYNLYLS